MTLDPAAPEPPTSALAERWVVVMRGEPRQVRRWLKCAWRGYGIRCESASVTTLAEQLAASRAEVLELQSTVDRLTRRLERAAAVSG